MPETTENYHRIPVSSGHGSHDIKTITIDSDKGIKALYCTDCKEVVTYLFDVDKWTMEEAKDWVESHKGYDNMSKKLDRRTKDIVNSTVRYKSYGSFERKIASDGGEEMRVRGFFTSDEMDEVGDVITKEATEKAIERWRQWGNIRTMHDYPSGRVSGIGKADGLEWNEVVTIPVDENTKKLIAGGVLKAYSVGIIPRQYDLNLEALEESGDDNPFFFPLIINEYDMVEISYVDHPANYSATISDVSEGKTVDGRKSVVLFKNLDISGEVSDMKDKDVDTDIDAAGDVDVEGEVDTDAPANDDAAKDVDTNEEPDVDSKDIDNEDGDDDAADSDGEPGEGVLQAVQDVSLRLDRLEGQISQVADKFDGLAEDIVGGFMDALSESGKVIASSEAPDDADKDSDNTDEAIDKDVLAEKVAEAVLKGLAEALIPEVVRSAHVVVDGDEEPDGDGVDITKKYMKMTPAERRIEMKNILREITKKQVV